jgi:regulator of protease activity HflC (stomatin/prohibitin superfamily)
MFRFLTQAIRTGRGVSTFAKPQELSTSLQHHVPLTSWERLVRVICNVPCFWAGFFNVQKNHIAVISYFGKFYDLRPEGLRYTLPFGSDVNRIFVGSQSIIIPNNSDKNGLAKVLDKEGTPIMISAMLNFHVENPVAFQFEVANPKQFLEHQAEAMVKQTCSSYSYDELKQEKEEIGKKLCKDIQERCEKTGLRITSLQFTNLCYAPEIAQQMLMKQQTKALVEARTFLVKFSVDIVREMIANLPSELDQKAKNQAAVNLLTVLVANSGAQNVLNLN